MKDAPYQTPKADLSGSGAVPPAGSGIGRALAVLSTLMALAGYIGGIVTVWQLLTLADQVVVDGGGDVDTLTESVSEFVALGSVWFGVGVVGLLLAFLTLVFSRYRSAWFFQSSALLSVLYLLAFPYGTALAVAFLFFLARRREEFKLGGNDDADSERPSQHQ